MNNIFFSKIFGNIVALCDFWDVYLKRGVAKQKTECNFFSLLDFSFR